MSLINQVLNDLEKRGASTNIGEATIRVVPLRQSHITFWLMVAAGSVIVLAVTAWLKWGTEVQVKSPAGMLAAIPAAAVALPASQPIATADAAPAAIMPAAKLPKPLIPIAPVIAAVDINPATSLNKPQNLTITGRHFAPDALVILRTPRGKVHSKYKIVKQNPAEIVVSADFHNVAGSWSVEVANDKAHSAQFAFAVQAAPAAASVQSQKKAPAVAAQAPRSNVIPVPAEKTPEAIAAGGVSKQPTQITAQQQAENEFRKAYTLMQQGQVTAAMSGYEIAIKLDPGHIVARQTLVRLLLENRRNTDAERVLQEGLQYDPKQSSLAMLLARLQVARNELPQAMETLQKSLPYAEKQADYQAFVAALMQRQSRHKEAIVYYQNAVQLSPQSGVWLMGLGISLRAEQRNDEARVAFNRALESHKLTAELQSFVSQQLKEL
jgi:MSHA biogenesis protein MshN